MFNQRSGGGRENEEIIAKRTLWQNIISVYLEEEPAHIQDNVSMSDMKHEQLKACFVLILQRLSLLQMQKKKKKGIKKAVLRWWSMHLLFLSDKGAGASRRGFSNNFSERRSNICFHRFHLQGRKKKQHRVLQRD